MEWNNGFETRFEQDQIILIGSSIISSGLSPNLFSMNIIETRENRNVDTFNVQYLLNDKYFFNFWDDKSMNGAFYLYNYFPEIHLNFEQGGVPFEKIIGILQAWLSKLYADKVKEEKFIQMTSKNIYIPEEGINIDDKSFSQAEFNALKNKIEELENTLFTTNGLTKQDIDELRTIVNEILNKAESPSNSKRDIEEIIIGKFMSHIKNHVVGTTFIYAASRTAETLLSIFTKYKVNELGPYFQSLFIGTGTGS
jgi:Glu-tRNA(Gln) amidotransferase subunit E-like FAD-binding protein